MPDFKQGCCTDGDCTPATCMNLPEGMSCARCVHMFRCRAFGFTSNVTNDYCSFFPRRFAKRTAPGQVSVSANEVSKRRAGR